MAPLRLGFLYPWLGFLFLVSALPSWAQVAGSAEGQKLLLATDEALGVEAGMGAVEVSMSVMVGEAPACSRTFRLYRNALKKATLWLFPSGGGPRFRGLLSESSGLSLLDADLAAIRWEALIPTPGEGHQWPSSFGGETVGTDETLGLAMVGPPGRDESRTTILFRLDWFFPDPRAPRYTAISVVPDKVGALESSLVEAQALDRTGAIKSLKLWIDKKTGLVVREERYDALSRLVDRVTTRYGRLAGLVLPTKKQMELTMRDPSGKSITVKAGFTLKYGKPGPLAFDITDREAVAEVLHRK